MPPSKPLPRLATTPGLTAPAAPALATPLLLVAAALALKLSLVPLLNNDLTFYVLPWLEEVRRQGSAVFGNDLTDYSPGYTYLLWLVVQLPEAVKPVAAVKLISLAGDAAMAACAARLALAVTRDAARVALAGAVVFALPAVIANSGAWGQTDSVWTSFSLLSLLAMHRGRAKLAVLCFGIAFAYKPQAVFLGPVLLAFLIRRRSWPLLALVPVPYLLSAVPHLLAGRSWQGVFGVYAQQFEERERLSYAAPNIWTWFPYATDAAVIAGVLAAAAAGVWLTWVMLHRGGEGERLSGLPLLMGGALSCLLLPFLTPKMHDRYGFGGEVMVALAACLHPRLVPVAIATQTAAMLAYQPTLLNMIGWRVEVGSLFALFALLLLARELLGRTVKLGEYPTAKPAKAVLGHRAASVRV